MSKKGRYSKQSRQYNDLRAYTKKIMAKKTKPDESEQLFEDDPRAAKEVEYGKIRRNHTSMWTRSNITEC